MLILLRKTRHRGNRVADQRDAELRGKHLTVGCGGDQRLQLFGDGVGAAHARVTPQSGGRLLIECTRGHSVSVDGQQARKVIIGAGQTARIGPHAISPLAPPAGFEAGIEAHIDADVPPSARQRLGHNLIPRVPGRRGLSYLLGLATLAVALGLPLLAVYQPETAEKLAESGIATDGLWTSGPLADAHHLPGIGDDCTVCHAVPFQRVRNQACLDCHDTTPAHFAQGHPVIAGFDDRCTSCHLEHNEPSTLVRQDDGQCTDCHTDSLQRSLAGALPVDGMRVDRAPANIRPVQGFATGEHPQFLAALVKFSPADGWHVQRQLLGSADSREASNLKFPHDLHLDHAKVSWTDSGASDDRALQCADCHTLEREGEHFRAVTMESSCANCHTLAFDDAQPNRQLPHGEPETLRNHLEEFYVKQAALSQRAGGASLKRRVPNVTSGPRCSGDVLACGERWADREMDKLFTKAGCVSCHEVSRDDGEWQVKPVRLAYDWYPGARFDHVPHLVGSLPADGNRCASCHEAGQSSDASDVLMPPLENCTQCHASTAAAGVPLQCLDCHSFHQAGRPLMTP
ncbi:MAG: hypothetical protein CMN28_16585 [Salinisphaeraceae bacterium]|nr:hypothetical protein [Salinisphaeraceae bacterium]